MLRVGTSAYEAVKLRSGQSPSLCGNWLSITMFVALGRWLSCGK